MAAKLFPDRTRCAACRRAFRDGVVLSGLYCSYRCAGHAAPAAKASDAPRECAYPRDGQTVWKRRFRYEGEVPAKIADKPDTTVYRCSYCLYLHTGTAKATSLHASRRVSSAADLAEVMVKARGGATRTQVAKAAKVRPIRVKEIEQGSERIDPDALFALARVYGLTLSVGFRR